MIRTATFDDLPALRALFARGNEAPYDLARVTEEKCFGDGIGGSPAVRVWDDVQGAVVTCGRYVRLLVVDREARGRGVGSALLADAEARGARVIGAEAGNYFTPGVPEEQAGFFRKRGYVQTAETHNLWADLGRASARPDGLKPVLRRPAHGESERVLGFIERQFGRIWRFEASKAFERDEPTLFVTQEGETLTGFAAHDVNNRGLGFFGPTGVAKEQRGRGLGCALLLASLADLHRLGYEQAVIPWTDAFAFYRRCCGAEPAHRFITFALDSAR